MQKYITVVITHSKRSSSEGLHSGMEYIKFSTVLTSWSEKCALCFITSSKNKKCKGITDYCYWYVKRNLNIGDSCTPGWSTSTLGPLLWSNRMSECEMRRPRFKFWLEQVIWLRFFPRFSLNELKQNSWVTYDVGPQDSFRHHNYTFSLSTSSQFLSYIPGLLLYTIGCRFSPNLDPAVCGH